MRRSRWRATAPALEEVLGDLLAGALGDACGRPPSPGALLLMADAGVAGGRSLGLVAPAAPAARLDADTLVRWLFEQEGQRLVRLARLFVDDRNAAEDLVQEAFIRLARSAHRIEDQSKAAAYLRSIVLNLTRDHNRRGLVSLRHHLPFDATRASVEDDLSLGDDQVAVIEALRSLPVRQRACVVLRYYDDLGVDDIAATLGISRNSVKTHLRRALAAMEHRLTPVTATVDQ